LLENDITIKVVLVDYRGRSHGSIDCQQDISRVETIIHQEGELF
jgi:3-deoxy-manno-octulosonate cytidylyltransferase (CMP-KDO synthetase)